MTGRFRPGQLVVTAEHASATIPAELGDLGLPRRELETHHAWDPGAAIVARAVGRAFGAPVHLGRWSRLVADLNRSAHHPRVVPQRRTDGLPIAGNQLDAAGRRARLDRYWRPWREGVEADLDAAAHRHGLAFHLSVHSFTDRLGDEVRTNDIGLLYRPSRAVERGLADRVHARLRELGYSVRRNYPYRGNDDGFCMRMRAERPARCYVGFEIEMSQRVCRDERGARELADALIASLEPELGG